ncbi:MAG: 5'/3'-nucleotidase SurE [Anaerolineae bacterium]
MPNILITNDDGYEAPALAALARSLAAIGKVTVFAPDHNWSAAGHTKTMHKPLRITEGALPDGTPLLTTTGTPSDCVGLALLGVLSEQPDLVISGINQGTNIGHDITYSGTVAAAMEGAVFGIPAIAASQETNGDSEWDLDFAAEAIATLAREVLARRLPPKVLLNVNFPALPRERILGIQVTRLGRRIYRDLLIKRLDPRGRPYYWIGGDPPTGEPEDGTDVGALAAGYISVTPLNLDMTDRGLLADMTSWELKVNN